METLNSDMSDLNQCYPESESATAHSYYSVQNYKFNNNQKTYR